MIPLTGPASGSASANKTSLPVEPRDPLAAAVSIAHRGLWASALSQDGWDTANVARRNLLSNYVRCYFQPIGVVDVGLDRIFFRL